jgi:putative SOS response-associated peptidase YedK
MCGRFTQRISSGEFGRIFGADDLADLPADRFNVAPTDPVAAVVQREHRRALVACRWGLVPRWASDVRIGSRLFNARAETVATTPAFRDAFRTKRCIIPANGFYEWQRGPDGGRVPHYVSRADDAPLAFAGLWSTWRPPAGGDALRTCTILTTTPNELVARLHDRMPVILSPDCWASWLDPAMHEPGPLLRMLRPSPAEELDVYPVAPLVNSVRNNGPLLVERAGPSLTA